MKSVCIISKGPSVLKCNTSFYNQFDEIIGINWPLYNQDYSKYLPKNIDIMISSQPIITPNEIKKHRNINLHNYTQQQVIDLNIKKIIVLPTHDYTTNNYLKPLPYFLNFINKYKEKNLNFPSIPYLPIEYSMDYYKSTRKNNNLKSFSASTGIRALEYISLQPDIKNICFIGIDNYDIKQGLYYYCKNVSHNSIVYDCHNKKETHDYINNLPYNFPDKNYYYISNTTFNIHKNLNKIDSNFIIK